MANNKPTPRKKETTNKKAPREGFAEGIRIAHLELSDRQLEELDDFSMSFDFRSEEVASALPIVVKVKNKTDEKLYNIPILDYNNEFSEKVKFYSGVSTISYQDILMSLKSKGLEFSLIRVQVCSDCHKFAGKQLSQTYRISQKEINGKMIDCPVPFLIDPMQMQSDICESRYNFNMGIIDGHIHNLTMGHLMPEVECVFTIFPSPIIKL